MITISLFAVLSIGYIAMDHLGVNKENQAFAQTNGTTMTNNTNTGLVIQQQQQFQTIFPANFTRAIGSISSIQNNDTGKPEWILSGQWDLAIPQPLKINQTNPPNAAAFNALIKMIKTDGTAGHIHSISDFNLTASVINNNNLALSGTATISMKEGPVNNVPITINIANQGAINLGIDPTKTDHHFGSALMYGTVTSVGTFISFP
jgi:hypothetical protein